MRSLKVLLKVLRNVLSIPIGLITYFIMEALTASIFSLLIKIPVLSILMTGFIPADIFLNVMVVTTSTLATSFVVKLISDYKLVNFSIVIVFAILLIVYVITLIYRFPIIGFSFDKLTTALIYIGTYIFACIWGIEEG